MNHFAELSPINSDRPLLSTSPTNTLHSPPQNEPFYNQQQDHQIQHENLEPFSNFTPHHPLDANRMATAHISPRNNQNLARYSAFYRQIDSLIQEINEHLGPISSLNTWRGASLVPLDSHFSTFLFWNYALLCLGACSLVYSLFSESKSLASYLIGVVSSSLMICRSAYGINSVRKKDLEMADNFLLMNIIIFVATLLFSGIYLWTDVSAHVVFASCLAPFGFFFYFHYKGISLFQRLERKIF